MAAVRNYHKVGGFTQQTFMLTCLEARVQNQYHWAYIKV